MKKQLKRVAAAALTATMLFSCIPSASAYYSVVTYEGEEVTSRELAKIVAEEGMILLKNEPVEEEKKALPLDKGESIAVFGLSQIDYVYGGGGSGSFITAYAHSLWDGLLEKDEAGEIELYKGLRDKYVEYYNANKEETSGMLMSDSSQGQVLNDAGEMPLTDEDVQAAAAAADTAIFTIGRMASEGSDYEDAPGNFQLSEVEKQIVQQIKDAGFEKIIIVLNVPYVIESGWIKDDPDIDAALCVSLPGMEGGDAMADVLMGETYPSGKTVDTWAYKHEDYPSVKYGTFAQKGSAKYVEDIFVGYRYFETIPGAAEQVVYEFGYGLSYADFSIGDTSVEVTGEGRNRQVTVKATVTNNSDQYAGKEVVQVYCGVPEGELTQPAKELAGYAKTGEIAPGGSETVTITFPFDDMASYDDLGATGAEHEAAYVLEAGEYKFYVGNSVRNAELVDTYELDELEEVEQLSHQLVPDTEALPERLTSDGTLEPLTQTVNAETTPEEYEEIYNNPPTSDDPFITFKEVMIALEEGNDDLLTTFVSRLTVDELIKLVSSSVPEADKGHRTGYGGLEIYGVPMVASTNGAAGIQFNNGNPDDPDMNATFFPCGTMQASTWNKELLEVVGKAMGLEAREFGMSMWQAPSMNLHRDPLCGRNFEYYSEDPLIAGWTAASLSIGTASVGFGAQYKHFALNNQETGRGGSDSQVSERALREIYLKGFEIAIKEGDEVSLMSAYNKINGQACMSSHDLLTEIARNEWGFDGFINTDFLGDVLSGSQHDDEIIGGTDLKAPWGDGQPTVLRASLASGKLQLWQLQRSAERVLRFIAWTEEGKAVADADFVYTTTLNVDHDDVYVNNDARVVGVWSEIPADEFMDAIYGYYNQTYVLLDKAGNEVTGDTVVEPGMQLVVTAEDGVTSSTYAIVDQDLAANKSVKASSNSTDAANVIDLDADTVWTGASSGDWIEVDLGADYKLTQLELAFANGTNSTLEYEVWTKTGRDDQWDSHTEKDRDFADEGYTLAFDSTAENVTTQATLFTSGQAGRYIAVKFTGSGDVPAIATMNVDGFRIVSDVYDVDNVTGTVYMPSTLPAHEQLAIEGTGTLNVCGLGSSYFRITVIDGADRSVTISRKNPTETEDAIGVKLDQQSVYLYTNYGPSTVQLTATVEPAEASQHVIWTSSDPEVATVNDTGLVYLVGEGMTTITATTVDGNFAANCLVQVGTYNTSGGSDAGDGSAGGSTTTPPTETTKPGETTQPGTTTEPEPPTFSDVPATHWAYGAVNYVVDKGLFNGTSDTTFSPEAPMTRAMFFTVLARMDGVDTTGGATWYDKAMAWAMSEGITDGTNPEATITREQLAVMLYRYAGSSAVSASLTGYADAASVSDWAQDGMNWAVSQSVITGKTGSVLDPQGTASRAEVATMLMRFIQNQGN